MERKQSFLMGAVLFAVLAWGADLHAQCSAGEQVGADCGDIPFEGCCDSSGWTKWCEGGVLCGIDCSTNPPPNDTCGWSADSGFYDCGQVGTDPTGTFPLDCDGGTVNPPDCLGTDAPSGSICPAGMNFQGCCGTANRVHWCDGGAFYCLDCSSYDPPDNLCGWKADDANFYDCGGSGADPSGANPMDCSDGCVADCVGKTCGDDGCGGSCGTCPAGQACQSGACTSCTADCTGKECGSDGCGGSCGSCLEGYSCKTGTCILNQVCVPACEGKECGLDGCDGVCGVCVPPKQCNASGTCYDPADCTPDCAGKVCGSDGCEGSCGDCIAPRQCNAHGLCVDPTHPSIDVPVQPGTDVPVVDTSGTQCPAGFVVFYGTCKAVVEEDDGTSGGSDCSAGSVETVTTGAFPVLLLAFGVVLGLRRRA